MRCEKFYWLNKYLQSYCWRSLLFFSPPHSSRCAVYLRVVCLITHIKPDIIKFLFFPTTRKRYLLPFFFCIGFLSSFLLNKWYDTRTVYQHRRKGEEHKKMQTRISLLNFNASFFFSLSFNGEPFQHPVKSGKCCASFSLRWFWFDYLLIVDANSVK